MSKTTTTTNTTTSVSEKPPSSAASTHVSPEIEERAMYVLRECGTFDPLPEKCAYSDLYRDLLKVLHINGGAVSCVFSVLPPIVNHHKGLQGGVVASIAERVSIACARTVVKEDTDIFLGEFSISYLSKANLNEEVVVDGSVVRSGRNLTVVAVEFRIKETRKLVYTARAIIYHMPVSKL